jgi:Ca-activated chloride channel family protein
MTRAARLSACAAALAGAMSNLAIAAQTPQFKSRTAAVRVDALVTDGRRPIAGLTAANFEVRDNGVLQTITDVHRETLPLNIICALDVSGSLDGRPLANLKRAYLAVIAALAGDDRAALLTFANRVDLHSALTKDRVRLASLIEQVRAGGTTSLFDAVFTAIALREADDGRTLLLFFSDGLDTSSWLPARKLVDAARRSDVVIYPITIRPAPRMPRSQGRIMLRPPEEPLPSQVILDTLGDVSGGRVVYASDDAALEGTFLSVLEEFRHRYVLSFTPTGVSDQGWHTLEVKLKRGSGQVRARRGYFAR